VGVLPFATDPAAIVAEAQRVLRPGGQAIFMVYNRRSWMTAAAAITARREGHSDAPGFHLYTRQEFDRLLAPFRERRIVAERFPAPSPQDRPLHAVHLLSCAISFRLTTKWSGGAKSPNSFFFLNLSIFFQYQ
jgi:SAM-dependent methyltransferase